MVESTIVSEEFKAVVASKSEHGDSLEKFIVSVISNEKKKTVQRSLNEQVPERKRSSLSEEEHEVPLDEFISEKVMDYIGSVGHKKALDGVVADQVDIALTHRIASLVGTITEAKLESSLESKKAKAIDDLVAASIARQQSDQQKEVKLLASKVPVLNTLVVNDKVR